MSSDVRYQISLCHTVMSHQTSSYVLWSLLPCTTSPTTLCSFACCNRIRSPAPPSSSLLPASWTFVQSSRHKTIARPDVDVTPAVVFHTNGPHHGGRHHVKVQRPDLSTASENPEFWCTEISGMHIRLAAARVESKTLCSHSVLQCHEARDLTRPSGFQQHFLIKLATKIDVKPLQS